MDLASALKTEILRPLTTLIIPGALAVSPYVALLWIRHPTLARFADSHPTLSGTLLVLLTLAAGHLLEDAGSALERHWDARRERDNPGHREARWLPYLQLRIPEDRVGQRYLRTLLVRMKFELSLFWALLAFLPGFWMVRMQVGFWSTGLTAAFTGFLLLLMAWVARESYLSCASLDEVRGLLLEASRRRRMLRRREVRVIKGPAAP